MNLVMKRQAGLTLVELMVATTLSLVLLAGVLLVFTANKTTYQMQNGLGTLQENGRNAPYPLRKLAHMFAPTSRLNHHYVRHVESGLEQVVWVMGAALFMSREVFEQVGGWDDQYFIYYEDSDICLRALHLGVPTFVDGDVRWVHGWARQTKTARSLWVWKQEFRSAIRFYRRHPDCIVPRRSRSGSLGKVEGTARP